MRVPSAAILISALTLCAALPQFACASDHDRLAKTNASSSSAGGMGGMTTSEGGTAGEGGVGGIKEPPGPTKLTIINGIVDSAAIRLCFLPYPDGDPSALPWPDAAGLPYALGSAIDPISDLIPAAVDVEVIAIGGVISLTGGMTCEQLLTAAPVAVQVLTLAVVPASVFTEEKSLLLVADGCIGGAGHSDMLEEEICGVGYSELSPNASLTAGFMSRIPSPDRVSMQFAEASRGLGTVNVRIKPGIATGTAQIAVDVWSPGAIVPFPPFNAFGLQQLMDVGMAEIQLVGTMGSTVSASFTFSEALANSNLGVADIQNGEGIVFVAVGAPPSNGAGTWWNAFEMTVVATDP